MKTNWPYISIAIIWVVGLIVVMVLLLNNVLWCWPAFILFMLPTLSTKENKPEANDGDSK